MPNLDLWPSSIELALPASSGSVIGPLAEKVIQNFRLSSGNFFRHPAESARTPFFFHATGDQLQPGTFVIPLYQGKFAVQNAREHKHAIRFEAVKNSLTFGQEKSRNQVRANHTVFFFDRSGNFVTSRRVM